MIELGALLKPALYRSLVAIIYVPWRLTSEASTAAHAMTDKKQVFCYSRLLGAAPLAASVPYSSTPRST